MTSKDAKRILINLKELFENESILEAIDMAISALSVIEQTKWERDTALATLEEHGIGLGQRAEPSDLISRADAIKALSEYYEYSIRMVDEITDLLNSLPSVSANPTVIRCTTFWNEEDFKEWADRIKEQNKGNNIIVIPCEAECVSAERVGVWIEKEKHEDEDTHITEWQSARCSLCGKYLTTPFMYYFTDYPYCPSCGAKMKGGAE